MADTAKDKSPYCPGGGILIAVGYCGNCRTAINISSSTLTEHLGETCPVCGCDTISWSRSVSVDGSMEGQCSNAKGPGSPFS